MSIISMTNRIEDNQEYVIPAVKQRRIFSLLFQVMTVIIAHSLLVNSIKRRFDVPYVYTLYNKMENMSQKA